MRSSAVFLDRDGVLVRDYGYAHRVEDLTILDGAVEGLKRFRLAGYRLVVVTNQSGIARGRFSQQDYETFTTEMRRRFAEDGVVFEAVLHCPHLPGAAVAAYALDCDCRKPKPGMIVRAATELGINTAESMMVGDRISDLQAGKAAGLGRNFLISPAGGLAPSEADAVFPNLDALAFHVLGSVAHAN